MSFTEIAFIEVFKNTSKGNETRFKKVNRVPRTEGCGLHQAMVTYNNYGYLCTYEDNLVTDPETGEQTGIFSDYGEEAVLVYRISQADKDFYAPAEIARRDREADEALVYLEQSKREREAGHNLAEQAEPGDVVTFTRVTLACETDDTVYQGTYQGPYYGLNNLVDGIEVSVNGQLQSVLFANIRGVTPAKQEQTEMTTIQTLTTKYQTYQTAARTSTEKNAYTEVLLALSRENPVADLQQRINYLSDHTKDVAYQMRLEIFEEALASLQPQVTTIEQADTLVEVLGLVEKVEEYEHNEMGHVYTLVDGTALVVTSPTTYHFVLDENQPITLTLGDIPASSFLNKPKN